MELKDLLKIPHSSFGYNINYYKIPCFTTGFDHDGAKLFNEIYDFIMHYPSISNIIRTRSGGISLSTPFPAYDIRQTKSMVELTIAIRFGCWRIQFRDGLGESKMSGRKAFEKFMKILSKNGIDLDKYALDTKEALEYKEAIPMPLIHLCDEKFKDLTLERVHHIDFHSSYPAGLINTHKEFENVIRTIYNEREIKKENKAILNYSIGYMQSIQCCGAKWSHLSNDAITDNNFRVLTLANKLRRSGRTPILFNTDGVWYQGEIYHGEGEGEDIGQWHNDHINCTFRAKSDGAYEFIEDGKYYPVVRGIPNESKKDWVWGDIYSDKAETRFYSFEIGKGISIDGEKIQ